MYGLKICWNFFSFYRGQTPNFLFCCTFATEPSDFHSNILTLVFSHVPGRKTLFDRTCRTNVLRYDHIAPGMCSLTQAGCMVEKYVRNFFRFIAAKHRISYSVVRLQPNHAIFIQIFQLWFFHMYLAVKRCLIGLVEQMF